MEFPNTGLQARIHPHRLRSDSPACSQGTRLACQKHDNLAASLNIHSSALVGAKGLGSTHLVIERMAALAEAVLDAREQLLDGRRVLLRQPRRVQRRAPLLVVPPLLLRADQVRLRVPPALPSLACFGTSQVHYPVMLLVVPPLLLRAEQVRLRVPPARPSLACFGTSQSTRPSPIPGRAIYLATALSYQFTVLETVPYQFLVSAWQVLTGHFNK